MKRAIYAAAALLSVAAAPAPDYVVALVDVTPKQGLQQLAFVRPSDGCRYTGDALVDAKDGLWLMMVTHEICGNLRKEISAIVRSESGDYSQTTGSVPLLRAGDRAVLERRP